MATRDVIAANLRVLRDLRGLSQLELADQVGLSRRTIARLEAAEIADPGIDQARSLAAALGVTLAMLTDERLVTLRIPVPEAARDRIEGPGGASVLAYMMGQLARLDEGD